MALSKTINFKGFETPAYAKISALQVISVDKGEGVKEYVAICQVDAFTNDTKEYDIDQVQYRIPDLEEKDTGLVALYGKIKELEEFEGWVDA